MCWTIKCIFSATVPEIYKFTDWIVIFKSLGIQTCIYIQTINLAIPLYQSNFICRSDKNYYLLVIKNTFYIYLSLLTLYCRMIMEYRSRHWMESTSVLQAMDQVVLWHIEKNNSCITCKSSQCQHTSFLAENAKKLEHWLTREYLKEDITSLALGESVFLERHSFWSWRRGPEASISLIKK